MADYGFDCLKNYADFEAIRKDWDEFMERCFPENYSRTHVWLSAWWRTYHNGQSALVYLQRGQDGQIIAAAPLLIRKENFGGFPVRSVTTLGMGIGTDDFLIGAGSEGFVRSVFSDLERNHRWHVARFGRVGSQRLRDELQSVCDALHHKTVMDDTEDLLVKIPGDFNEYLKSRSSKFRRNLNRAVNRLERKGNIALLTYDPFKDAELVRRYGSDVAQTSWQYLEGRSHFNENGSNDFYMNLTGSKQGAGGEEFNVLMIDNRPVAYLLSCRRGRVYYAVDTAFHADFRQISAGRVLFSRIIKNLTSEGSVDVIDFEGNGEYKHDYANVKRKAHMITIFNNSLYPRIIGFLRGNKTYNLLRERWKKR